MNIAEYLSKPKGALEFDILEVSEDVIISEINQYMTDAEAQAKIIEGIKEISDRIEAIFELDTDTRDEVLTLISENTMKRFLSVFFEREKVIPFYLIQLFAASRPVAQEACKLNPPV